MPQGLGLNRDGRVWILLVAFYGCLIFSGCIYFSFSLFVKPLQAEFGWDRSTLMAAFTLLFLTIGLTSPFSGKAVDRYGPKAVMSAGALISATGFLSLLLLSTPLHYYLCYVVIGIGGAAMGPVPSTSLVSEWFKENRGLAIGLTSMGIGVGGLILAPIVGGFVIPVLGWKAGYLAIGLFTATLVPFAVMGIRKKPIHPSDPLLPPNPAGPRRDEGRPSPSVGVKKALFSASFCLIAAAFMMSQFGINGTVQSQVPHLQDIGFPVATASAALGALGLTSAFSKLFFGWLCDRIQPKNAFLIGIFFMIGGTSVLRTIQPDSSRLVIWLYAVIMGFGAGSWLPIMSMLVSTNFGLASYGTIFGAVTLAHNIGVSTGPLFAGHVYDRTMGYEAAFTVFIVLYVCAASVVALMKQQRRSIEVRP